MPRHSAQVDLIGQRFGRLTVVAKAESDRHGRRQWLCRCDCGEQVAGDSQSCGCASRTAIGDRARKHGLSRTPEYVAWVAMIQRCTNPRHPEFRRYGARGISVCPEWAASFEAFFRDMGHRPSPKHSIDRMDNDAGYSADNCRWTTQIIQMQDMRRNRYVTHDGVTLSVAEWARRLGVDRKVLGTRLYLGWPFEKAISTPVRERRKKPDAV